MWFYLFILKNGYVFVGVLCYYKGGYYYIKMFDLCYFYFWLKMIYIWLIVKVKRMYVLIKGICKNLGFYLKCSFVV